LKREVQSYRRRTPQNAELTQKASALPLRPAAVREALFTDQLNL
jgi:hypothetical protein